MFELNKKSAKKVTGGNSTYLVSLSRKPRYGQFFAQPVPMIPVLF